MRRDRLGVLAVTTALAACGSFARPPSASDGSVADGAPIDAIDAVFAQRAYIKASNAGAADGLGNNSAAVSADGATLAIGAHGEASAANGIGGDQTDNSLMLAGAVYVFVGGGATWTQQAYIKASNTDARDEFGFAVALSADGTTLAVSAILESSSATGIGGNQADDTALESGAVYVFTRTGTAWMQQAYLKASNTNLGDFFGSSVALAGDGNTLVVGAEAEDSAAIGINGAQADNTAINSGAAYVFTRTGVTWTQQAYLKPSNTGAGDFFGRNVTLSSDGRTLAVGAYLEDSAATGINSIQSDNSATDSGAVYVFTRAGTVWTQEAYVKASNPNAGDSFGFSLALAASGNTLAITAPAEDSATTGIDGNQLDNGALDSGATYIFSRAGTTWTQQAYLKASNTGAGDLLTTCALSADGNSLAVGAYAEASAATGIDGNASDNTAPGSGAAYRFLRTGATWMQQGYVKASNTGAGDRFGLGVALSADAGTLVVGADHESSAATGVGGDEADNSATNSGAIYVFQHSSNRRGEP